MEDHHIKAIKYSVEIARKILIRIDALKEVGALTKPQEYEREMTIECIRRGEAILKENEEQP